MVYQLSARVGHGISRRLKTPAVKQACDRAPASPGTLHNLTITCGLEWCGQGSLVFRLTYRDWVSAHLPTCALCSRHLWWLALLKTVSPLCPKCLLPPSSWPTTPFLTPLLESMLRDHLFLHSSLARSCPLATCSRAQLHVHGAI